MLNTLFSRRFGRKSFFLLWFAMLSLIGIVLWFRGMLFLDPDFGWHLRFGQIVLHKGIPFLDQFSYTMPSFSHINHEWFADVFLAFFYPLLGNIGFSMLDSLFVLFVLVLSTGVFSDWRRLSQYRYSARLVVLGIPFLLAVSSLLYYSRVRYQSITWFFSIILFHLLFRPSMWKRWRLLVPLLFLVWANLHGGFSLGIFLLVFSIVVRIIRERRFHIVDLLVVGLSILLTTVNPYGIRLWGEIWSSLSDPMLRSSIQEWMPVVYFINYPLPILIALSFVLIIKYHRQFAFEEIAFYFLLLFAGLLSQRHIPLWIFISLSLTTRSMRYLYEEVLTDNAQEKRFLYVMKVTYVFSVWIILLQSFVVLKATRQLNEESFYPKQAVVFLREHVPDGEIFSKYGWGGYLIWKLPEKKVFVDGRMPSWRREYSPQHESLSAFDEFMEIMNGDTDYRDVFLAYKINTVLWSVSTDPQHLTFLQKLDIQLHALEQHIRNQRFPPSLENRLEQDGWIEVYRDSTSVVYQRPD